MPKFRKYLSIFLAVWLCVMLVAFTYTWVSRNWTPSIEMDDLNVASAGALVISIQGDDIHTSVDLNDIIGWDTFTFRQVSSQDGATFFRKDFTPKLNGQPAKFYKIVDGDAYTNDYVEAEFYLELDTNIASKYIFIHPETSINYDKPANGAADLNKAIRISLSYERTIKTENGTKTETGGPFIIADMDDNTAVARQTYTAVVPTANEKTEEDPTAIGYQTVHGLHYFDCGRDTLDGDFYDFQPVESEALFKMNPGETVKVTMRIWLEGQDENCINEIAGKKFNLKLKFDSIFAE